MQMTRVGRDQIFLFYALTESGLAIRKLDEVREVTRVRIRREPGIEVRENGAIFEAIRLALQSSANVSKVFWPAGDPRAIARGRRLRELTGIPDDHPLRPRKLRNHIEHMDERLDDWTAESPRPFLSTEQAIYMDMESTIDVKLIVDSTVLVYMESDNSVHLFGEHFLLDDLRAHVVDAQGRVSSGLASSFPSLDP